jgi:hypothetical protein
LNKKYPPYPEESLKPNPKKETKKLEEIKNKKNMMIDYNGATKKTSIIPKEDKPDKRKWRSLVMLLLYYNLT